MIEEATGTQRSMTAAVMLGIVCAAGLVLTATVGSLASAARRRRLAALQLLGAPTRVLATLAALQAALLASVGVLAGLALAGPVTVLLGSTGVLGVRWWASASLPAPATLVTAAVTVVVIVARRAARSVEADPWRVRRRAADRPVSAIRLAPLLLGTIPLVGIILGQRSHLADGQPTPNGGILLLGGAILSSLLGLVASAPLLARVTARLLRRAGLTWRLGAARADHHARTATRLSAAVVVILMAIGVVAGVRADITGIDGSTATGGGTVEIAGQGDTGSPVPKAALVAALRAAAAAGGRAVVETAGGHARPLTAVSQTGPHDAGYDITVPSGQEVDVAAAVQRNWPEAPPLIDDVDLESLDDSLMLADDILLALVLAVIVVGVAIGLLLLAVQDDRRAPDGALLATGMSRRRLAAARATEVVVTTLPGSVLAAVVAAVVAEAVMHIDDPALPWRPSSLLFLPALAALLGIALAGISAAATPGEAALRARRD